MWDGVGNGANAPGDGFVFKTIGVAFARVCALVGLRLEHLVAFDAHGFIDEQADAFGEAFVAMFGEVLQNGVQEFRIGLAGHFVVLGWMCW